MNTQGEHGHQFRAEERNYTKLKERAETLLLRMVEKGTVKVGSEEWRNRMDVIEMYEHRASVLAQRFDDNA